MKQVFSALKLPILLFLLLVGTNGIFAQCYQTFLKDGIKAFDSFQLETAINKFKAAIACPDRPTTTEADEWLVKAQNAYIGRLQLIASLYITSEGQRVFQQEKYALAFRLYQEAIKFKSDNEQAKNLLDQLVFYLADYQYAIPIDFRFFDPNQIVLTGNGSLVVFDENKENNKIQIKLIDPGSREIIRDFKLEGEPSDYQFSDDGKWLAVEFYNQKKDRADLSIWNVDSGELVKTFDNIYKSEVYKSFTFSGNSEKLVYRSVENMENNSAYSLNVYDLNSKKPIYTTGAMVDYYADSSDGRPYSFRRETANQNFVNEKISTKFSIDGAITTNNQNFVLKENEFRIRTNNDFAFSPDGKKFAFNQISEEQKTEIRFDSEVKITFGTPPKVLIGNINVINLEDKSLVFSAKSDYKELPQRFLPFSFSKSSKHLIFVNSRRWNSVDLDKDEFELESKSENYQIGFNSYNFEKQEYDIENQLKIYDFFVTENNLVVTWAENNAFISESGKLNVYDLNSDTLVFSKYKKNEFSHFYDVKSKDNLLYFSTFNPNTFRTTINILNTNLDSVTIMKDDFISFDYTYARTSPDQNAIAFLTPGGKSIRVWNLKTKQQIREVKCQAQIAEFDFSNDANFLIIRDENDLVKVIDLKITENIYEYFDNYLEKLTPEERKEFGIDW